MRVKFLILFFILINFAVAVNQTVNSVKHKHEKIITKKLATKANKKNKTAHVTKKNKSIKKYVAVKRDYMNGIASYYGDGRDGFNGKQMANGKYFDSKSFTAAHPTVPLGTKLKVTNISNNRVIYVEVTDRMPKKTGRVIDLSYGVGKYLGILKRGIARVKLEKVTDTEYAANKDKLLVASNDKGHVY